MRILVDAAHSVLYLPLAMETTKESAASSKAGVVVVTPGKPPKIKDSTSEIPMIDLGETINFVLKIHTEALEMAAMPAVAKGTGYSNPTSTPFYRRLNAARVFGLISTTGAGLTKRATDYFKPQDEDAKPQALVSAILGIPYYAQLVEKWQGKKLNADLVKNAIASDKGLTDPAALACEKVFEDSLKFAGLLAPDRTVVNTPSPPPVVGEETPEDQKVGGVVAPPPVGAKTAKETILSPDMQSQTLILDKANKTKTFTITAPISVTEAEYQRICSWLKFVMIVEDDNANNQP